MQLDHCTSKIVKMEMNINIYLSLNYPSANRLILYALAKSRTKYGKCLLLFC